MNPFVLKELVGWLSDRGPVVVGVDLENAQRSNRYVGEWKLIEDANGIEWVEGRRAGEWFRYRYLGETAQGLSLVETLAGGQGSGSWRFFLLLKPIVDNRYEWDSESGTVVEVETWILRCRGILNFPLGADQPIRDFFDVESADAGD